MRYLTLLTIILSINLFAQEDGAFHPQFKLTDGTWRTDYHCFSTDTIDVYTLTVQDEMQWSWGNSITFTDSTFQTDYSAPCGMDCFTNVYGTYKYVGNDQIEIYVKTISRNGLCMNNDTGIEEVNRVYGVYRLEQTDNGMKIIKEFN